MSSELKQEIRTCHTCTFLRKKPGKGNYFIYTCLKWNVISARVIPYGVVNSAIGEKCPFHNPKVFGGKKDIVKPTDNDNGVDYVI